MNLFHIQSDSKKNSAILEPNRPILLHHLPHRFWNSIYPNARDLASPSFQSQSVRRPINHTRNKKGIPFQKKTLKTHFECKKHGPFARHCFSHKSIDDILKKVSTRP